MNNRLILLGCAACLSLPLSAKEKDKEETPLGKQMEHVNDALKAIRKETDPAKGAAEAREAQQALIKAMSELPALVKKMPDGPEKVKAAAEYRKMIGRVFVSLCEMEEAFLAGKTDEVAKIAATLKDMKKAGHDKFMEKEEE
jgi:soluble cytochrome b562